METRSETPRTSKVVACPACHGTELEMFFSSPDRLHGTPGIFTYERCLGCGTVFQNPMVIDEDLHLCYPSEYAPYNVERELPNIDFDSLPERTIRERLRKAIVDSVRGKTTPSGPVGTVAKGLGRIPSVRERAFFGLVPDQLLPRGTKDRHALDLGCGAGWLMQKLKKVGWQVDGLEWNAEAAARARELTGGQVWQGDFRSLDLPISHYQLIVLNHVFEHFSTPRDVLSRLHGLLSDGGRIALFFPNPDALGARIFETEWFAWEVPRHLVLPTGKAIRLLAKEIGFSEVDFTTRPFYSVEQWKNSNAYRRKENPDVVRPDLRFNDRVQLGAEYVLAKAGFEIGWEAFAVLTK